MSTVHVSFGNRSSHREKNYARLSISVVNNVLRSDDHGGGLLSSPKRETSGFRCSFVLYAKRIGRASSVKRRSGCHLFPTILGTASTEWSQAHDMRNEITASEQQRAHERQKE
jgi:hypothetical protein